MSLYDAELSVEEIMSDEDKSPVEKLTDYLRSNFWIQIVCAIVVSVFVTFIGLVIYLDIVFDRFDDGPDRYKYYLFLIAYLISTIIAFAIWVFFMKRILRPLYEIKGALKEIREGNLYKQVEIKGSHEIWELLDSYNQLAAELADQKLKTAYEYEERMKAVELKNAAERRNLESAVNTGFLYDIMNNLDMRGDTMSPLQRRNIIHRVGEILKYINPAFETSVNMGSEIDWIDNYLYVKKYLTKELFDYDINIEDKYREWPCIKLFLLPFIDNCIDHAFKNIKHGGMIKIFASESQNRLVLNIWDNGCGLSLDTKKKLLKTVNKILSDELSFDNYNMNLQSIFAKLYYFYGERLEIKINSDLGDGTCFTLILPLPNRFSWQGL